MRCDPHVIGDLRWSSSAQSLRCVSNVHPSGRRLLCTRSRSRLILDTSTNRSFCFPLSASQYICTTSTSLCLSLLHTHSSIDSPASFLSSSPSSISIFFPSSSPLPPSATLSPVSNNHVSVSSIWASLSSSHCIILLPSHPPPLFENHPLVPISRFLPSHFSPLSTNPPSSASLIFSLLISFFLPSPSPTLTSCFHPSWLLIAIDPEVNPLLSSGTR